MGNYPYKLLHSEKLLAALAIFRWAKRYRPKLPTKSRHSV